MDIMRHIKPLLLALIMFFSMRFLGFNSIAATMFSLIPFVLGYLNIMTRFAYSLTAIIFITAAVSSVIKSEDLEWIKNYIRGFVETVEKEKAQKDEAQKEEAQKNSAQ